MVSRGSSPTVSDRQNNFSAANGQANIKQKKAKKKKTGKKKTKKKKTGKKKATSPKLSALALELLKDPDLLDKVVEDVHALGIAGEVRTIKLVFLVAVSRLLPMGQTLALILLGSSSTGKSIVLEAIAKLLPLKKALIDATDISVNALYHAADLKLRHKLLLAGERSHVMGPEQAEATRAWRELMSRGYLTKLITTKDGNKHTTKMLRLDGPIAFLQSTTGKIFPEDKNRCLIVSVDDSEEQTRRILVKQAAMYSGNGKSDHKAIIGKHHALQEMLEIPDNVTIPFAEHIAANMPSKPVEMRRGLPRLFNLISAVTVLYQKQRKWNGKTLIATEQDYRIARDLYIDPFHEMVFGGLSESCLEALKTLKQKIGVDISFSQDDAATAIDKTTSTVSRYIKKLGGAGIVEILKSPRGQTEGEYRIRQGAFSKFILPDLPANLHD